MESKKRKRKKKNVDKKVFKLFEGQCRICGNSDYECLDVHRINPGSNGGKYTKGNSVVLCANCHRQTHDGKIEIDRYYLSTDGSNKLRVIINGKEEFL